MTLLFAASYAAKTFLDQIVGDDEIKWIGDDRFTNNKNIPDGFAKGEYVVIGIGGMNLRQLYAYKLSQKEKEWNLPAPYTSYVANVRGITPEKSAVPPPEKKKAKPAPAIKKTTVIGKKREVAKDEITISDIAEELKMAPSKARAALRGLKMEKPAGGWVFKRSEADAIKKKIVDAEKGAK